MEAHYKRQGNSPDVVEMLPVVHHKFVQLELPLEFFRLNVFLQLIVRVRDVMVRKCAMQLNILR